MSVTRFTVRIMFLEKHKLIEFVSHFNIGEVAINNHDLYQV